MQPQSGAFILNQLQRLGSHVDRKHEVTSRPRHFDGGSASLELDEGEEPQLPGGAASEE